MSFVLPFKLYSKAYLLFFQFHAQSYTKTLKQCTYQFKIKYKHQSIFVYHRAHPEGRFRRKLRRVYSNFALPIDQREVNIADKILIPK
jgi:hypothetical protein